MTQLCRHCFDLLGKPFPFHTAEDCEATLARLGAAYGTEDVHYELVFPDTEDNRLCIGRFLLRRQFSRRPAAGALAVLRPVCTCQTGRHATGAPALHCAALRVGEGIADGAGLSHRATDLRLKGRASTPPLPMRVLLELLGLPVADADFIKQWCHDHMLLSVPGIGAAQQLRYGPDSRRRSYVWKRALRSKSSCNVCRISTWCLRRRSPTCRACLIAPCNIAPILCSMPRPRGTARRRAVGR